MKTRNAFCTLGLAVMGAVMGSLSIDVYAAGSMLRITCYDDDVGAEVLLNGKSKGKCPVDIMVPEGSYKLRAVKTVDDTHERVFEQEVLMGEGTITRVEAILSEPRLNVGAQQHEDKRLAVEHAEAAKHEAERLRADAMERAIAAKREAESSRITAKMRVEFDAALASGSIQAIFRDCADCPEMVAIPPNVFEMGSSKGSAGEKPVHMVTLAKAFAMGKTEVTQGQWKAIMGSFLNSNNPSRFPDCGDNCPVESVSWLDAQEFIQKLNAKTGKQYRLPSEAEWEYACRAGGRQEYCGSDSAENVAWYNSNTTHPAGQKQANAFGLYDMSGNVWEWVEDSYHDNYNGAPADGTAWQGSGGRVLRGGSWDYIPQETRAAIRLRSEPESRNIIYGFRLARTLP